MGDPASSKIPSEDRPARRSEVSNRTQKAPRADDVISTVTEDSFISFRKKFHFPNDLVMKVPARTDRACFPPPGYVTVYEFSLRAGLRFPPSSELIDILTICGVCLSQFSYRAMSIVMGLIVLFRDRGVVLSSECLSRMGRLFSDAQGRISFRSKWLDIRTRDPSKGWISNFFYEKWGKLKELHVPLHIGAEDLLRILKLPDLDALHYEVRYLSRYIDEEYLFKVGLSTQAGRSHAQMLKKSARVPEMVPQKNHSKRPGSEEGLQASRKKRADETVVSKGPRASPSKLYIPEEVLNHQCIGRRRAEELYSDFKLEMTKTLNDWNKEFVKVKYLQGKYKKKYDSKVKEMKVVEDQLEGCRAELANKITSASSQNERMDRLYIELVEAQATIKQQEKTQQVLEAENERLQSVAQQSPSAVIEEFKKSYAFKIIVEDHIQEARNHIYDVEVKALEAECAEDGFIRGFMKGVRTVHRKTGAEIEGLTPSQASGDASSDSGGEELESELQRAFALEEDEDDFIPRTPEASLELTRPNPVADVPPTGPPTSLVVPSMWNDLETFSPKVACSLTY
ncbi:hypothetical protein IEQ34_017833 [Dendrobium chrysotoxum]|uniref:Uncharacterized protein n=1 Tax=Dendrobium chrysotoxum TaxID=161865 RepID=A0AAV7FV45_DENCH|nr:hypothetical protein IEQ34_017833 [Dendrobium chrysotoxum]